jgi:hypothetical protein
MPCTANTVKQLDALYSTARCTRSLLDSACMFVNISRLYLPWFGFGLQ